MKIVVLESSPHKKGSSNLLAEQFVRGAEEAGHRADVLDVARMDLHPCLGCGSCGMDGECVRADENRVIRDALLSADMVVLVTPIYYYGMSAQLKTVIDRFYSYNVKLSARHLKAVLIAAAMETGDDVMPYIAEHYKKLCRYLNFENCGMILGTGCGSPPVTRTSAHMESAYRLGKSL